MNCNELHWGTGSGARGPPDVHERAELTNDDRIFLITGATGKTGSGTVDLLLKRGHRVRAMVHREDERSQALARAGAEIAVADLHDLDAVTAAVQGVSGAYFCY